jgi:imidazolonepropionase-like amidohydrolase
MKALKLDQTVVVTGNRISAIGQTGKVKLPEGAQIVDAGGRYLIPGLWDMHVHALNPGRPEYFFNMFVANGVTGVRDMGGSLSLERMNQIRADIAAGRIVGPRLAAIAGKIVDGPGTRLDVAVSVSSPDEGRRTVRALKRGGADFIKVYDRLSRETYEAIVDEAKELRIPVAGHVPFSATAEDASDLGQKSIEHTIDILITGSPDQEQLRAELRNHPETSGSSQGARMQAEIKAAATYDERKTKSLFVRFVRNQTWQCPTLVARRPSSFSDNGALTKDLRMRYIPANVQDDWNKTFTEQIMPAADANQRAFRFQKTVEIVGAMQRAGVGILAGTDVLNPYVYPGFSIHDELALLVKAGLTPMEALRTATVNPARFLGITDSSGTIEKGRYADLVLLDANPLDNINNTQRIQAVIVNGRYFSHSALQRLLSEAESFAKK